jgi:hypothetical protein
MANKERGEFALQVQDRAYTLRLTTNACCELEDFAQGRTWDQVMAGVRQGRMKDVRLLIWTALRQHHPDMASDKPESVKTIGDLIDEAGGLAGILGQIQAFLQMNLPEAEDVVSGGSAAARPPNAQAGTGDRSTSTPAPSV